MWKKTVLVLFLGISLAHSQIQVRGGELASNNQQLYGRYEVRMRTAQGEGILSTFFTYENDGWKTGTGNPWREIDIEVLGRYTDRFQTNLITGTADSKTTSEYFPTVGANPADGYHTYAIEWTPDYISFLFDGQVERRTNAGDPKGQVEACRGIPQSYRFNMWANAITGWVGTFNPGILPRYQFVNWIKYYSYSEQSKTFTLAWTDDFNTLDNSRWYKGTHTIEDFTQFHASNILVKDGTLILALTDMQGTGLNNINVPPDHAVGAVLRPLMPAFTTPLAVSVKGRSVTCAVNLDKAGKAVFKLINPNGRVVDSESNILGAGSHTIELGKGIAPGLYLLHAGINQREEILPVTIPGK